MRSTKTNAFMGVAIIFLILALLDGIFRLMSYNGISSGILQNIYALHPMLMVFGFLACIVMAERVSGISVIPDLKQSLIPHAMVPLIASGLVSEVVGYLSAQQWMAYLGASLLFAGCMVFAYVLARLAGKTGTKLPFYFMIVSTVSLAASAILSTFSLPEDHFGFVMLLLSFPVVFILGERVELTRFTASPAVISRFKLAFLFATIAVAAFLVSSLDIPFYTQAVSLLTGNVLLFLTLLVVLSAEIRNFKLLSKTTGSLQRYVFSHTRVAYAWGIAGVVMAAVYFADSLKVDLYDPFIHCIAVGFIGTMLLAHGPVILPTVTGRKLDPTRISLLPLGVLTLGNLLRVVGDLLILVYHSQAIHVIVGLSGWFVFAAVLIFLKEILLGARAGKQEFTEQDKISSERI